MILEKELALGVKQGLWITPWMDGWSAEKESADCPVRLFFILEDQHRAAGMVHQVIGVATRQHPADSVVGMGSHQDHQRVKFLLHFEDFGVGFPDPEEDFVFTLHLTGMNRFFKTLFKKRFFSSPQL